MSKLIHVETGTTTIDNTTTETDLFNFDVYEFLKLTGTDLEKQNFMGVRVTIGGSLEENAAGTPTFTFKSYVNGVSGSEVVASPVSGLPTFKYVFTMLAIPGKSTQPTTHELFVGGPTATGSESFAVQLASSSLGDLSEDLEVRTTIAMSTASADVGITKTLVYVELL
jgi:hypothetical protein